MQRDVKNDNIHDIEIPPFCSISKESCQIFDFEKGVENDARTKNK